jgi:glycosyltransferase involved in cell wall biosynthesis
MLLRRLAAVHERTGRLEEAAACWEAVLQRGRIRTSVVHVRGGQLQTVLRLGELYARMGQPQRVEHLWREFLNQHPHATSVRKALDRLVLQSEREPGAVAAAPGRQNFLVVITAYNARPYLGGLVASLAAQRWPTWRAVFVDDCSTDGTPVALRELLNQHRLVRKFQITENAERRYRARNLYDAIKSHASREDVIAVVDGDDCLATGNALGRLAREYDQGWEIVWSNWRGSDGSRGTSGHLNPFISPRRQPFVSSHLYSFRQRLFDAIRESDLQDDDGKWFTAGSDVAIAWPLLDQTIKRKHIEDVLYVYNRANPLSHDKLSPGARSYVSPVQAATSAVLRRRQGKEPTVDNEFLHAHLYELMQAAMLAARRATSREIAAALAEKPNGVAAVESNANAATDLLS